MVDALSGAISRYGKDQELVRTVDVRATVCHQEVIRGSSAVNHQARRNELAFVEHAVDLAESGGAQPRKELVAQAPFRVRSRSLERGSIERPESFEVRIARQLAVAAFSLAFFDPSSARLGELGELREVRFETAHDDDVFRDLKFYEFACCKRLLVLEERVEANELSDNVFFLTRLSVCPERVRCKLRIIRIQDRTRVAQEGLDIEALAILDPSL